MNTKNPKKNTLKKTQYISITVSTKIESNLVNWSFEIAKSINNSITVQNIIGAKEFKSLKIILIDEIGNFLDNFKTLSTSEMTGLDLCFRLDGKNIIYVSVRNLLNGENLRKNLLLWLNENSLFTRKKENLVSVTLTLNQEQKTHLKTLGIHENCQFKTKFVTSKKNLLI